MSFDAFLFDLDGTLVDTADDLGFALNRVLSEQGFNEVGADVYRAQASNGSIALLCAGFGPDWQKQDQQRMKTRFLEVYADNICLHSRCFEGIDTLIKTLNENSVPWGIMTNKPGFLSAPLVASLEVLRECKALVSGDTLSVAKPSPEPLLHTARLLNVSPERCIYIGDAERDIAAAQAANMISAAALWGYIDSEDSPQNWGAHYQLKSPEDALHYI